MSTFRSNNEFQHFMQDQESNRVRSTARLPNGRNPTIPTLREVMTDCVKEMISFDGQTVGYTVVGSSQQCASS
jgi:hypothetical protein